MKVIFTGGGSGGHFYPIIAVAQALHKVITDEKLLDAELFYLAPTPYDANTLFENNITWRRVPAGKIRHYFSLLNIFDVIKTGLGIVAAIWQVFKIYPDVIFSKGGYVSFPVLFAAKLLRIPVIIHESDSVPGKVNKWAAKFAEKIAVSYQEAAELFPKEKVAYTGNPIRKELTIVAREGAHEFLQLEKNIPVILVLGGSQGAELINDHILDILPDLVSRYQVLHQAGKKNLVSVKNTAIVVLGDNPLRSRYRPFDSLNVLAMRMAAGVADLVVSRAGSTIFEIAAWNTPSIIIPITSSSGDHQRKNAYNYARSGAAIVIEENNLTPHLLISEINRLIDKTEEREKMRAAAKAFIKLNAADLIAKEILRIALKHEVAG